MRRFGGAVVFVLVSVSPGAADGLPLVCFGNEPSWSVDLTTPGVAKLTLPGQPVTYRGAETRNDLLRERMWRGGAAVGGGGEAAGDEFLSAIEAAMEGRTY